MILLSYFLKKLVNYITVTRSCLICKTATTEVFCSLCRKSFKKLSQYCNLCGVSVISKNINTCGKCNAKKPIFDFCIGAYIYEYPVKQLIHLIKYQTRHELIKPLTFELAIKLNRVYRNKAWPQIVIPVPMHKSSLKQRGFDQVLTLANYLIKNLTDKKINLKTNLIYRNKKTIPQHLLTAKERDKNVSNAFKITAKINYQHVAILDDVVTSAATVTAIARLLKKSGVKKIDIWCLARANINN